MNLRDKDKAIGIIITAVFHGALILVLIYSFLHYSYPPADGEPPEPKKEEIMFGGEYVMLGNVQQPASDDMDNTTPPDAEVAKTPTPEGEDVKDAGQKGDEAKALVSSKVESPMKVKEKKTVKSGPTKEEIAAQEQIKKEKEAAEKIKRRVAFGKSSGSGSGKEGSPNGNSSTGARSGAPGVSGLSGYTLASWGRPNSPVEGSVRIRVRVNARGKVIEARYVSGNGSAASNASVRRSCEQASMSSQFSVPVNTTTEAVGYITWRFE